MSKDHTVEIAERAAKNRTAFEARLLSISSNGPGTAKADLAGEYVFEPLMPVIGQWYYAAKCPICDARTAFISDPAGGRLGAAFSGAGAIRVSCVGCGHSVLAHAASIESIRWS